MSSRANIARDCAALLRRRGSFARTTLFVAALLAGVPVCPSLRAQEMPAGAIGRVEGNDISVASGTPSGAASASPASGGYVSNGSVVTVHDGKARLALRCCRRS